MITISANDLKTKGVSAIEDNEEALITVRGRAKYVLLDIELYERLREAELEIALQQTHEDIKTGRYVIESVEEHIKRITKDEL